MKLICPICNTNYEGDTMVDECPVCDWIFSYAASEDEYDEVNYTTIREAKQNFAKGLDIWGKPLKSKKADG